MNHDRDGAPTRRPEGTLPSLSSITDEDREACREQMQEFILQSLSRLDELETVAAATLPPEHPLRKGIRRYRQQLLGEPTKESEAT